MSICAYYQGTLYADRSGIMASSPAYPIRISKLYVSNCRRLAVAIAGKRESTDFTNSKRMKLLVDTFVNAKFSGRINSAPEGFLTSFDDQHLLIATKTAVYKYRDGKIGCIDLDSIASIGTGSNPLTIAILAGKSIEEALVIAGLSDSCSFVTEIDKVKMSDLK